MARSAAFSLLLTAAFLFAPVPPAAAQTPDAKHVSIRLIAENGTIRPGETVTVGIEQTIEPHWHTYWLNPGDSGTAPAVAWSLPAKFEAGDIKYPVPEKLPFGPLVNYGYENKVVLLQDITAPATIPGGPLELTAAIDILVCAEVCIPESHTATLTLNGGTLAQPAAIAQARAALPVEMGWETHIRTQAGGMLEARVTTDSTDAFHKPGTIDFLPEEWGLIDNTAQASAELAPPGLIVRKAPGERALSDVPVTKALIVYEDRQGARKAVRVSAMIDKAVTAAATPAEKTDAAAAPPITEISVLEAIVLAFLGGIILNLMPCVFPVLSMKALSLVNLKDKEINKARKHGLAYTAGVILSFGAIAALLIALKSAGGQIGWGFQLQNPVIVLALAYLLFIIGLNLAGLFEFSSRLTNIGSSLASKSGYSGSFFTGILATLVATPCTAPFMGVAMGFALTLPAVSALTIFGAMGFGLALPYLLLTFVPTLRRLLPHPGPWMETFRQFLAFPMFASAAWLVWVLAQQADPMAVFSALLGMVAIAFAIWLFRVRPTKGAMRLIAQILAVGMLAFVVSTCVLPHPDGMEKVSPEQQLAEQNWEDFTQTALDALLADGHPVFVNMTAAWCITCKVNEKVALSTDGTRQLFKKHGIRYLKGDWTNQNPEITQYLASYGRSGVPIYVFYAPRDEQTGNRPAPVILPQILTPGIVEDTILSSYPTPHSAGE